MFDTERLLKLCGLPTDDSETLLKEEIYDKAVMTHMPRQDAVSTERLFSAPEDADDESKARIDIDINIGELEIEMQEATPARKTQAYQQHVHRGTPSPLDSQSGQHADTGTIGGLKANKAFAV